MIQATYSPEDNKLRLYPDGRLDPATYERVRGAGFVWAAKQGLFVAPAWTPERADLAAELAGEIEDEDRSLVERAEERAERFEGYREARTEDASAAQAAVARIADGIPLGQPILVGHHSERHARKDAQRIEAGMRRAVKMWETAGYWRARAAGALRHAKYKERPDVRARRIRSLESELRKQERTLKQSGALLKVWRKVEEPDSVRRKDGAPTTLAERVKHLANLDPFVFGLWSALDRGTIEPQDAQAQAIATHEATEARAQRWAAHLGFRLEYERAMLAESGGTVADRNAPEVGGGVKCWASPRGGWSYVRKVNRVSVTVLDNFGNGGRTFSRTMPLDKLSGVMSRAEVEAARAAGALVETDDKTGFFVITTSPEPPRPERPAPTPQDETFRAMREQLRSGPVEVVAVPELFPTPDDLAREMVELADIGRGSTVLEPSAGTGAILRAIVAKQPGIIQAVELDERLVRALRERFPMVTVRGADFLACTPGDFGGGGGGAGVDRIVMNPPFGAAADVEHIRHAFGLLRRGGRLVAICAGGPRQERALRPWVEDLGGEWRELPSGTFAGTGVRSVLLSVRKPVEETRA